RAASQALAGRDSAPRACSRWLSQALLHQTPPAIFPRLFSPADAFPQATRGSGRRRPVPFGPSVQACKNDWLRCAARAANVSAGDLAGKRERALTGRAFRTAVDRLLATTLLFIMVGVTAAAQAGPSPEEYVAHVGGDAKIVAFGEL